MMFSNQFRNNLNIDQIRRHAPSAFAPDAASTTSDRYQYIPSAPMLEHMLDNGWQCFQAYESRTRIDEKKGHTKHIAKFMHPDFKTTKASKGATYAGMTFTNSSDGSSSFRFTDSLWEQICGNGLTVLVSASEVLAIRHQGDAVDRLRFGLPAVMNRIERNLAFAEQMGAEPMSEREQLAFAAMALDLRWTPEEREEEGVIINVSTAPIQAKQLVRARHGEDTNRLYPLLNVVQENIMRGGIPGRNANGGRTSTREIKSVDSDVRINTALWAMADGIRMVRAS